MVPHPVVFVTSLISLDPIPEVAEELPDDLKEISYERHVNNVGDLWHLLMYFWPSCKLPPYLILASPYNNNNIDIVARNSWTYKN